MADLKAPKRNDVIGRLADILQSGKDTANQYQILPQVPLIGGTGLGDMFMGKAPELINDISYDGLQAAIRGGNTATGGIGTYGARPAVADAALLGLDVAGIGKGLGGLSRRSASALYDKLIEGGTSLSRREALKKLGALSGGAAIAGSGVGVLRKLADNVVTDVAPKVLDNVAVQAAKKYKFNSLTEYLAYIRNRASEEAHIQAEELGGGFSEDDLLGSTDEWTHKLLRSHDNTYQAKKKMYSTGGTYDPEIYQLSPGHQYEYNEFLKQRNDFSPTAKQEMKDFKQTTSKLASDFGEANPEESWMHWAINSPEDDPNYFKSVIESFK